MNACQIRAQLMQYVKIILEVLLVHVILVLTELELFVMVSNKNCIYISDDIKNYYN